MPSCFNLYNITSNFNGCIILYAVSVIQSEDYDEFVTSTIMHDVNARARGCAAPRVSILMIFMMYFEHMLENSSISFSLAIKVSWSVSHRRAQPVYFRTNRPFLSFLGAVNI